MKAQRQIGVRRLHGRYAGDPPAIVTRPSQHARHRPVMAADLRVDGDGEAVSHDLKPARVNRIGPDGEERFDVHAVTFPLLSQDSISERRQYGFGFHMAGSGTSRSRSIFANVLRPTPSAAQTCCAVINPFFIYPSRPTVFTVAASVICASSEAVEVAPTRS
jgi:hypothetical protein